MTEPQTTQPVSENEAATAGPPPDAAADGAAAVPGEGEAAPPPEPEPWTPERVSEWNAYYDRYVVGTALLLVLIVSCNYVTHPSVFLHLRAGQLINERMGPVTTDEFSYTREGQPWVDVPWLFEWSQAALYNAIYGAVPVEPQDQTAHLARADRIAIGGLGLVDAVLRVVAAWILLKIRHKGPGLWWSAICVTLALGMFFDPANGLAPGGLATVPGIGGATSTITPAAGSRLLFALELLILFRGIGQGRGAWLWGLIPLFVFWANWDVSFLTGLLLFAAVAVGHWLDGGYAPAWPSDVDSPDDGTSEKGDTPAKGSASAIRPAAPGRVFLILGICVLAGLANPWTYRAYVVAAGPFVRFFRPYGELQFRDSISFFSGGIRERLGDYAYLWTYLMAFYMILVGAGVGSFMLNSARFSWRRFLPFALVAVLWGLMIKYSAFFAPVFAAVLALNGQEWYQSRFGARGRLGSGWTLWSTGGRVITLIVLFGMVFVDMTGRYISRDEIHFGLGYNADRFPIEVAEYLERQNELQGNILNTSTEQGDLLLWKAYPKRKVFVDDRTYLFPRELLERWDQTRKAIRDDNVEVWKPALDEYKISAVMIDPAESPATYRRLKDSPNWVEFYDDGHAVMFGRKDAPAKDVAFFESNRLEPARIYHATNPLPPFEGPPTPTSWIDDIFRNRTLDRTQRRTEAALRWLMVVPEVNGARVIPEPARCLLAVQDARIALSRNPDDPTAYRILSEAYKVLSMQEAALLAGIPLTPENQARIGSIVPSPERLINRYRQRITALNYAIQTTPTPTTDAGRNELFDLNMQLYELYLAANFRDLARDRLGAALALNPTEEHLPRDARIAYQGQYDKLDEYVNQIARQMEDLSLEQQPRVVDLAGFARRNGAVGLAITRLAEAEASGDSTALVKPQLVDLYCSTGMPEKAMDLISGTIGDPNLGTEPGIAVYRQGLVYYLLGNYISTASLWGERALMQLRMARSSRALDAAKNLVHGLAAPASNEFLAIPGNLDQQATWEFDLAMCELEAGRPEEAAKHFTNALTLEPDLTMRPIAAYYLEKLGKPVPPARKGAGKAAGAVGNQGVRRGESVLPGIPGTLSLPAPGSSTPAGPPANAAPPEKAKKADDPPGTPK